MDMILLDKETMFEIGVFDEDIDIEIGDSEASNDFEIVSETVTEKHALCVLGSEIGGIAEKTELQTGEVPTVSGITWRGMLDKCILEPPAGTDYITVNTGTDLNTAIRNALNGRMGGFFKVPSYASGILASHQFRYDRYCTVLYGLSKLCDAFGARLKICAVKGEDRRIYVYIEAVERQEAEKFNKDDGIRMAVTRDNAGINHMILLGRGELRDRMVRHLYVKADGSISVGTGKYYTGKKERQQVFDYPNAESEEDLIEKGKEKLEEVKSSMSVEIDASGIDLEIGDVVIGSLDGVTARAVVSRKIIRSKKGNVTTEYRMKGEG